MKLFEAKKRLFEVTGHSDEASCSGSEGSSSKKRKTSEGDAAGRELEGESSSSGGQQQLPPEKAVTASGGGESAKMQEALATFLKTVGTLMFLR